VKALSKQVIHSFTSLVAQHNSKLFQAAKRKLSDADVSKHGRKRLKPSRFQPDSDAISPSKSPVKKSKQKSADIIYRRGCILAILNPEGVFCCSSFRLIF
jgi:hypothetical protein